MPHRSPLAIFLLLTWITTSQAAVNDWTKPCFSGSCSYDVAPSSRSAAASLQIWSTNNSSISDITEAAGWIVLGCNNSTTQDIRLVCNSDDADASGCNHVYQSGAEDTIVRLPASCGIPFARVTAAKPAEDQSLPDWAASKRKAGSGTAPVVHSLTLDTNWASVDASKFGTVYFGMKGTSAPSPSSNLDNIPKPVARRSRVRSMRGINDLERRGILDSIKDGFQNAVSDVSDFSKSLNKTFDPIDLKKDFNLVNIKTPCDFGDLAFKVDVDADIHAQANFGFVVSGSIIPPKLTEFAITTGIDADVDTALVITASASNSDLSTGDISLFTLGLPGLDIPGIFAIGPQFILKASATAKLEIDADVTVQIAYHVKGATATFPPDDSRPPAGEPQPDDSPLKLSVSPGVQTKATISAHLTPTLELGISAFGSNAGVFVDLDASANLVLELDANAKTGINPRAEPRGFFGDIANDIKDGFDDVTSFVGAHNPFGDHSSTSAPPAPTDISGDLGEDNSEDTSSSAEASVTSTEAPSSTSKASTTADSASSTKVATKTSASASASASSSEVATSSASTAAASSTAGVQGCISANVALLGQVGTDAKFFDLFDKNTKATIFRKTFQLFKKCLGSAPNPKGARDLHDWPVLEQSFSRRSRDVLTVGRRDDDGLTCPAAPAASPVSAVDETVPAASIESV